MKAGAAAWAMIDWANSAFAIVVMTAFFPAFLKDYWGSQLSPERSTELLGWFNSLAGAAIALLGPWLGALADKGGSKLRFLAAFTFLGALSCCLLPLIQAGNAWGAGLLYTLGCLGFSGNNLFYDALLPDVAPPGRLHSLSALGYALGYFGSGLLFLANILMVSSPQRFGFASAAEAVKACFFITGIWWALFTLPALFLVKESAPRRGASGGFRELWRLFREIRADRAMLLFLCAFFFYNDVVNTIIKMAVDYGKALGLDNAGMFKALLLTQFLGVPAAVAFGALGSRIGALRTILGGLLIYALVCLWGWRMKSAGEFMALAALVGLAQGGVQSLSRSYFATLLPAGKSGEYFGFFNSFGRFSAVLGPALLGLAARLFGSRNSILALLPPLFFGIFLLLKLKSQSGAAEAA